jgi:hypothetical protein
VAPSDTVVARERATTTGAYQIHDLSPEMKAYLFARLQDARRLVWKYDPGAADSPFDAGVLDAEQLEDQEGRNRKTGTGCECTSSSNMACVLPAVT